MLTWARDFDDDTPYDLLRDHPDAAPGWRPGWRARCSASDT
ncbi:hypothetical protein PU560_01650 [Georgenia sp. 10Sc9-8]|uniref:Uncharacterized protein n=1 Tax=Georgenia halotolerans TaxID=3028317 RepID=A0ABT5TT87_9MICO|nr:hypothetical protein [Georgenia halotolerans]